MKRPNDFTKLDPTAAARNGKASNGLDSVLIVDAQALLYSFCVYNGAAADRYVQLHDSRTLPSNGSKPVRVWKLPPDSTLDLELVNGRPCNEGICLVLSSTSSTLTYTNANEALLDCTFSEL